METEGFDVGSANNDGGIEAVASPIQPVQAGRSRGISKCAVCRRDHKKCVRTSDDEKCERCQANDYDCFGGTRALSAPKQVLNWEKCEYCRKAKQKCLPFNRVWPDLCDRCTEKGLPCSAPINSRKRPRIESTTSPSDADELRHVQPVQSESPAIIRKTPQPFPFDSADQQPRMINKTTSIETDTTLGLLDSSLDLLSKAAVRYQQADTLPSLMYSDSEVSRMRKEKARARWRRAFEEIKKMLKIGNIAAVFLYAPSNGLLCSLCVNLGLSHKSFAVQSKDRQSRIQREPATLKDRLWSMAKTADRTQRDFPLGDIPFGDAATIRKRGAICPFCRLVWQSIEDQIPKVQFPNKPQVAQHYGALDELTAYIRWQNDGRELLVSGSTRPRSRRISIRWSREESQAARHSVMFINDAFIVPVGDQHRPWESNFLGRRIRSDDNVSMLVKNWDEQCQRNHSHNKVSTKQLLGLGGVGLHNFRLIDVVQMRTVSPEQTTIPQYVALSYTWVGKPNLFFRKENFKEFEALGSKMGVRKRWSDIPRTIQDAITLVQKLEYRYLWVDVLCTIFEDSPVDHYAMGQIFGQAFLTICAADGHGPDAGLVAFNPPTRPLPQHFNKEKPGIPELDLMVSHPAQTWINQSIWNSRGWTFQERMLSKRCLIFVAGRVYWECRSGTRSQDIIEDSRDSTWSINMFSNPLKHFENLQGQSQAIRAYMCCVEEYSPRRLSFAKDKLLAFENVGNLIGSCLETGLLHGLPSTHLDFALLWEFKEAPSTLEIFRTEPNIFPTWSWAGWDTPTIYRHSSLVGVLSDPQTWIKTRTWISWYVRDRYNITRLLPKWGDQPINALLSEIVPKVESPKLESPVVKFKEEHPRAGGKAISSPQGAREPFIHIAPRAHVKFPEYNRSMFFKTVPDFQSEIMDVDSDVLENNATRDTKYLQFWTWSGFFRLYDIPLPTSSNLGRGLSRCGILDDKDDFCGTIVLPDKWVENSFAKDGIDAVYELVAISEAKNFTPEEFDVWTYYIPKEREDSEWDLWYVLLVEKIDDVVVRRVGLGKVFQEAFENSCAPGKEWREFIMA